MSSLDSIFTLQPEELFEKSTLEKIKDLPDAQAIALLPAIGNILAGEIAAWAKHCAIVQSTSHATLMSQLYVPEEADMNALIATVTHHLLETMPARFAVLASKSHGEPLEPMSEIMTVLHNQVQRYGTRVGMEIVRRGHHFTKAVSELEATMTALENSRMEQLMRVRTLLLGTWRLRLPSTKHVVALVAAMDEMGVDFESMVLE